MDDVEHDLIRKFDVLERSIKKELEEESFTKDCPKEVSKSRERLAKTFEDIFTNCMSLIDLLYIYKGNLKTEKDKEMCEIRKESLTPNAIFYAVAIGWLISAILVVYMVIVIVNIQRDIDDLNHKVFPTGRMFKEEVINAER